MAKVTIERKKAMPATTRGAVMPGQVFSLVKRDGSTSRKQYLHIANNGRLLSVNLATGELASTANTRKKVAVVGKGKFVFNTYGTWQHKNVSRRQVRSTELFRIKNETYAALGKTRDGKFIAVNVAKLQSGDYTAGRDADKDVTVVGDYRIAVEVAA